MKRWILALLVMLAASPGFAKPRVAGPSETKSNVYTITFPISDTAETDAIGVTGSCSVRFSQAGGDDVSLYAIPTATTAATSGTLLRSFTSSTTTTPYEFTAGTLWVKAVATDATAGGSILTINCSPMADGRGGDPDADNDGLYEYAYLWDADGDGSTEVTCTAANTAGSATEPACNVAGEVIYRDFADDLNCAMHGCGFGQMERNGSIYLKDAVVYVVWPCWEPTNTNNPSTATTEAAHDTTSDTAWGDCPASPDPVSSRRLGTIATLDWQGEIIGAGYDTRKASTTSGYTRNQGTYIVNDMGPSWDNGSGTSEDANSWWGQQGFVRGINTGFLTSHNTSLTAFVNSGEDSGDFDSGGYATASGNQTVEAMDGVLCITEANIGTPVAGDNVIVIASSDRVNSVSNASALLRVQSYSTTDCNGAGTASITLGGAVSYVSGFSDYSTVRQGTGTDIPHIYRVSNGDSVVMSRSDVLDPAVTFSNITFAPQDAWNDSGNACSGAGTWTTTVDVASTDFDCDTNPMFGFWGGGRPVIRDSVILSWHHFAVDGESGIGNPLLTNVKFLYGNGNATVDAGSGWNIKDIEIRDTMFSASAMALYGPGITVDGVKVYNSVGTQLISFGSQSTDEIVRNIEVDSSAFTYGFSLACGASGNRISNVTISNQKGFGTSFDQGMALNLVCNSASTPITGNYFKDFIITGAGFADDDGTGYSASKDIAIVKFDTDSTKASPKTDAIIRNRFEGFQYLFTETSASHDVCMFAMLDENVGTRVVPAAGDYNLEQIFAHNVFYGNTLFNSGSGTDNMYCDCDLEDGSAPGDPNSCADAIKGGAANGVNARGCMNTEGAASVSSSLQTCS